MHAFEKERSIELDDLLDLMFLLAIGEQYDVWIKCMGSHASLAKSLIYAHAMHHNNFFLSNRIITFNSYGCRAQLAYAITHSGRSVAGLKQDQGKGLMHQFGAGMAG